MFPYVYVASVNRTNYKDLHLQESVELFGFIRISHLMTQSGSTLWTLKQEKTLEPI